MCGIFALLLNRPLTDADIFKARQATQGLAHRGPDGTGEWFDRAAGVYLGHRRLAIIDLTSKSDQPILSGEHVIIANCEIYNYLEIRRDLISRGTQFASRGDTETLLKAWQVWGRGILDRLDGMYAFVIWDGHSAHLAVDPFGEKPLVWGSCEDGIVVSSEMGPLVEYVNADPCDSEEKWAAYFGLGYFVPPETAFKNVFRLPASSYMCVAGGEIVSRETYWRAPQPKSRSGPVESVPESELDKFRDLLTTSVERRLIADTPLAHFLSGGIDSPLIAAVSARELGHSLDCLTVSFSGGDVNNESSYAAAIAKELRLNCEILDGVENNSRANAEQLVDLHTEPSGNTGIFPMLAISQAARKKVKVALSGVGGDEIVWGYSKNQYYYRYRHVHAISEALRRAIRPAFSALGRVERKFAWLAQTQGVRDSELMMAQRNYPAHKTLLHVPGYSDWLQRMFGRQSTPTYMAVPQFDMCVAMPGERLVSIDLASMRVGLEIRTPYLSRALVQLVSSWDARALLAFGQKSILRRLLRRYLPNDLIDRPKSGFRYPTDLFLANRAPQQRRTGTLSESMVSELLNYQSREGSGQLLAIRLLAAQVFEDRYLHTAVSS